MSRFCDILYFRYRKYKLGNDIELVVRCEHDAVTYGPSGELAMMNIKSLNEWDSRVGFVAWSWMLSLSESMLF